MTETAPTATGSEQAAQKLRAYTYRALTCKGSDNKAYNEFLNELVKLRKRNECEPTEASELMMANLILALRNCVSVIRERKHDKILAEILGIHLWRAAKVVQDALVELLTSLVVANAAFIHTCLQVLVFGFLPPLPSSAEDGHGPWKPKPEDLKAQKVVVHALNKVLSLVPTAPTHLLPLIVSHMPHKLRDRDTQCMYLRAVIEIAEARAGAPIRDGLLAAVVEHLLSLDVEIRWEDIVDIHAAEAVEEEGESESEEEPDMFELEGMAEGDMNLTPEELEARQQQCEFQKIEKEQAGRGGWECADTAGTSAVEAPPVDLAAEKLDSMMELVFAHVETRAMAIEHHMALWDVLIGIFERSILHTHRSKFTQYLLFFACMKRHKTYSKAFVDFLITRLRNSTLPIITRSSCAAYLASFLARAAFVPDALVVQALSQLTDFCQDYASSVGIIAAKNGQSGTQPSYAPNHQVFYASVQAILYVLCYHLEPLVGAATRTGSETQPLPAASLQPKAMIQTKTVVDLLRERLPPILAHPKLAPLNVCLPSVVTEFKHQASSLGLLDLSVLVPSDDSLRRAQRPLEMFFPFDPYLLQRSSRFLTLKTSYVRWKQGHPSGVAGAAAGEDDDSSSSCSDASSEDDQNVDELDDELEGLSLEGDVRSEDGSGASSSDSETESGDVLGHGQVDMLNHQPGMLGAPRRKPVYRLTGRPPLGIDMKMRNGRGIYSGSKHGRSVDDDGRSMLLSVMGASYSPNTSSMGDVTPTGTSPVLVDYAFPGSLTGRSPASVAISMTPPNEHMAATAKMPGLPRR